VSFIKEYKIEYLNRLNSVNSFKESWNVWGNHISTLLNDPSGQDILNIGDKLSEIYKLNDSVGRGQGSLSAAGASWECLVMWYLNLIYWNTNTIITTTNKQYVPKCIRDVLTVTISNTQTNTESDIVVFSVPEDNLLDKTKVSVKYLNDHILTRLGKTNLMNLQCKTNWNENSQIPMLWDMIYNSRSSLHYVSVGTEGVNPNSLESFCYGFVTVPTNNKDKIKRTSISVLRVKNLTGGNYWGHPSSEDIASSIKELPNRFVPEVFEGGISAHISNNIAKNSNYLSSFTNLSW